MTTGLFHNIGTDIGFQITVITRKSVKKKKFPFR